MIRQSSNNHQLEQILYYSIMKFATIFLAILLSKVNADPGHPSEGHGGYGPPGPAKYDFSYGIQDSYSGANFGHLEARDGYATSGSYYVDLPDGRTQKITYTADQYGYHPVVTYSGKAHFPSHGAAPYIAPKGGYH